MTILDRYVARQFVINLLILILIFFSFIVAVDATLNMSKFVRAAERLLGPDQSVSAPRRISVTLLLIADLWWPRLLQLFNYLIGIIMVAAMGFTCAQMVRHRETVAVMAGGLSLSRLLRPIVIVTALGAGLQVINQELVLPRIAPLLTRDHGDVGQRTLAAKSVLFVRDSHRRLWLAGSFNVALQKLTDVHVYERDDRGVATRLIRADSATWTGDGWTLERGVAETPAIRDQPSRPLEPISFITSDLDPTALTMSQYSGYSQNLSFSQIGQVLAVMGREPHDEALARRRDRLERLRWGRFSMVAANFMGVIISAPFFLVRVPRNMLIQSLKCAPVALGAIMGGILGAAMPLPAIPAPIAVFIPVVVLAPMALHALASIRS